MLDRGERARRAESSWQEQLRGSITSVDDLREWVQVSAAEERAIERCASRYRWAVTPFYASLMDVEDPACPIRRQAIPSGAELVSYPGATVDPVGDTVYRRTNRVVHKYPDRIVLLVTDLCPVYCRHCTRKHHTMAPGGTYFGEGEAASWEEDFAYIAAHAEIRDVLLTGGDPLVYSDSRLERILSRLRGIPHVEIVRIGSRCPVVLPQRITPALCAMLECYHPLWLNTQFNHAHELTPQAASAVDRLLRHGIVVQNQSVLLRGVNDELPAMKALLAGLLRIRVRPYYLYHCDNAVGVSHFATTLERGRELMRGLLGFTTGFGVPQYVLTTPLGKIPLWEEALHHDGEGTWVENYKGQTMHVESLLPPDEEGPRGGGEAGP